MENKGVLENKRGKVFWLTGLSGTGKTTLGLQLQKFISDQKQKVFFLDGDEVREFFENDLGYTKEERMQNVKRIGFAAYCLSLNGINVVVANIAPYITVREFLREKIGDSYIQIYLQSLNDAHIKRDVKGLYRMYYEGKLKNMIGLDDVYEQPRNPHLIIDTSTESENHSVEKLINFARTLL